MITLKMIKLSLAISFCFLYCNQSYSQDCTNSIAMTELDANNVKASLLVGGDLWWNGQGGQYIVPKPASGEPEVSAIFTGALWLGGYDDGGNLKVAGQTYGTANGSADYWPGPLTEMGTTTEDDCINFDRFWSTNSDDINAHIADWNDNGVIDGPVAQSILSWPARGNPNFESIHGFGLPDTDQGLAPFFDVDANGLYEPDNGDYPDIHEANQAKWWVFNDAGGIHTESGGVPLQFEIQVLAYAFSSSNDNINNATFYDYKFINRAQEAIDSAYAGFFIDPDLGCFADDYIGCDTSNNLAYVYNMDALDGLTSCDHCFGVNTYCTDIPVVGMKILNGVKGMDNGNLVDRGMSSFIYFNNGGISPPPPPGTDDPQIAQDFYNYLTGSWRDGLPITYGGNGHNPFGEAVNYAFFDNPSDPNGWSMCSEGLDAGDRRMVIGSGPFRLEPGGVNNLCFAMIFAEDVPHPCPDISPLLDAANDVEDLYNGLINSTEKIAVGQANIQFQPNPMTDQAELIFNELENSVQQVSIFSIDGKLMRVYDSVSGKSLTIERNEFGQGMYFYKILTDDFQIHSGKFIVQ